MICDQIVLRINGQPAPTGTKTTLFYDNFNKQWMVAIDFPEVRRAEEITAKRADSLGASMIFDKQQYNAAWAALRAALKRDLKGAELVGTLYTLGEGNDMDICVLVRDVDDAVISLEEHGYEQTGKAGYDDDEFTTFRKGYVNLLLSEDEAWFNKFLTAAEVCRYLKTTDKEQRKAIHRIIMNDATATGEDGEVRDYNWEDNTPPTFYGGPLRAA